MKFFRYILYFLLTAALISSCTAPSLYYKNVDRMVTDGRYKEAASLVQSSKETEYGDKNDLLYYLDQGMLLHLSGDYQRSNEIFEKAKTTAQNYFTKSITTEASTFLINDNMRPYYGEDFERAMIHVFSALNYVALGQEQEALVEARQVDHFFKTLQTNYGYKDVYKEDAFVRYMTGMLYENQGEINDAFISYRQALEDYETYLKSYYVAPPKQLIEDALRTAKKLGFQDEIREIEKKWNVSSLNLNNSNPSDGELVIIHYNGFSPVKVEDIFEISFGKGWAFVGKMTPQGEEARQVEQAHAIARSIFAEDQLRISFPKYLSVTYNITNAVVSANNLNTVSGTSELVQNIGRIAEIGLEERIVRIRAKAIARAAVRYALSKRLTQKITEGQSKANQDLANFLVKTALNTISTVI
ncbi:hypothetical protein HZA55_09090, partial [Candidatus Poribacteria bacterium]|nr:hypothetical protein [Candidatus Poribacteria bacterium]